MLGDQLTLQVRINVLTWKYEFYVYIRISLALDDIGHGVRVSNDLPRQKRASSQSSSSSLVGMGSLSSTVLSGTLRGHSPVPPAPTSKPPTPPLARGMGTGSLTKGSREYRTPPAVAPPQVSINTLNIKMFNHNQYVKQLQVPSNYAANYPLGHSRRERNSSSAYGTLPMPHVSSSHQSVYGTAAQMVHNTPQVGMVHPQPHNVSSGVYAPSATYAAGLERHRSYSNPRKKSLLLIVRSV